MTHQPLSMLTDSVLLLLLRRFLLQFRQMQQHCLLLLLRLLLVRYTAIFRICNFKTGVIEQTVSRFSDIAAFLSPNQHLVREQSQIMVLSLWQRGHIMEVGSLMAIFLPIYPVFFLSPSFVGPGMPYTPCVRVVSVPAGVSVLSNVHHAPQVLQLRYHIYYILPLIIQKEDSSLFVIY